MSASPSPQLSLSDLSLYNTSRMTDPDVIAAFVARRPLFERILADVAGEEPDSRPQHHLIIGQRGMGKTMLLARMRAELRQDGFRERFIPLGFSEEQYELDRLSKFWLNCLDALADALEWERNEDLVDQIDDTVHRLKSRLAGASEEDAPLANETLEAFLRAAQVSGRRPVLLVDNLQLVFERISEEQQHSLREVLMRPGCPIVIGASPSLPGASRDYGAAFYDHFKAHYLRALELGEMRDLMLQLAQATGRLEVRDRVLQHPERLAVLRQLTGGNPRTAVTLFFLYAEDFSPSAFKDLEALLDRVTPLYKARFEELSSQQQVIVSAIANHWDPVTSRQLADATGLASSRISPQLDRLEKIGFIEKVDLFEQSSTGYQIAERFFNIWYLMRSASRRQRRDVEFLTRFLQQFYDSSDRVRLAQALIIERDLSPDRHILIRALIPCLDERYVAEDLVRHSHLDALRQEEIDTRKRLHEIIDVQSIPAGTLEFHDLRRRLAALVPKRSATKPDAFVELVLGSRFALITGLREALSARNNAFTASKMKQLVELLQKMHEFDVDRFGGDSMAWFSSRLSSGQLLNATNVADWERSFSQASGNACVSLMVLTLPKGIGRLLGEDTIRKIRQLLTPDADASAADWNEWAYISAEKIQRYNEAENACRMILDREPDSAGTWNNLGNVLVKNPERLEEAEAAYRKALELDPNNDGARNNLGVLLAKNPERHEEAESAYRKALALNPNDAGTWCNLGILLGENPVRFEEAEATYRKALEIEPSMARVWNNLGILLAKNPERFEEAEAAYRKALVLDPNEAGAWNNLGILLAKNPERFEEAEAAYRKALELDPSEARAWNNLGNLLAMNPESFEEAEATFRKALELDGDNVAWNGLGNLYCDHLARFEDADLAFSKLAEIDPGSEAALSNLIFVRRDFRANALDAVQIFDRVKSLGKIEHLDTLHLHESLFAAYDANWGLSREALAKALSHAAEGFSPVTRDDWMRASAVFLHLNYVQELLAFLEERGDNSRLRPWYEGLRALHLGDRRFLQNVAPEVRTAAEAFYDGIEKRLKALPESTSRRPKAAATKKKRSRRK